MYTCVGRKVSTATDIIPVEAEYFRYKQVKAELEKIQEKKRPTQQHYHNNNHDDHDSHQKGAAAEAKCL
jgi:hypothetical protein